MGGPRSASRWGLLLRMEEEDGGVAVAVGGAAGVMDWVKPGSSCMAGGAVYGGLSKSPTNSISWLLMNCSISSMSLKRAVSISLGSFNDSVGSRLSNEGSSNDRVFIFTIVSVFASVGLLALGYRIEKKSDTSHVPTFARKKKKR